jgi:catechol 2,3-dioxygenase-like lactoylglutathione lyase family enzyme
MSTKVVSLSLPVTDQDEAIRFYTDVLGFELIADVEAWPGARWVEVALPDSGISVALLPPDSEIPVALRLETDDAESAYRRLAEEGVSLHNDEVLRLDGFPPMFHFSDHDGNELVYIQRVDDRSDGVDA